MTEGYVDLDVFRAQGETIAPGQVETDDYTPIPLTPPGNYISHSRTIKMRNWPNGGTSFEVSLVGGVTHPDTGKVYNGGKYPLKKNLSMTLFEQDGRPGKTSSVAEYLRACGFNPKQVDVLEALQESQSIPVKVFISRTNRAEKLPDGTWSEDGNTLKTKDFLKEDGSYADSVIIGGKLFKGKEKIGSFGKI